MSFEDDNREKWRIDTMRIVRTKSEDENREEKNGEKRRR